MGVFLAGREKIRRAVTARQLIEYKRGLPKDADLLTAAADRSADYLQKETLAVSSQLSKACWLHDFILILYDFYMILYDFILIL